MSEQGAVSKPDYLTVRELAELLRLKERKVYDLAASGEVPVSRATGKLLFPRREIEAWINGASSGGDAAQARARPAIFLGSHDPLLEWALRQSRCGLATCFDGSLDGLDRFVAGEGLAAALHIHDQSSRGWNVPVVSKACADKNVVLVTFARRQRGLVMRAEHAEHITGISDLPGFRIVPRQPETGTQIVLEHLLSETGLSPSDLNVCAPAPSENDAVLSVAGGRADVAFGLLSLARQNGLAFAPVIEERFDLLIDRRAWFEPQMQRFLDFCRGPDFVEHAANLPGYDVSGLGKVRWNA